MNTRIGWVAIAAILVLAVFAGFHTLGSPDTVRDERRVTVETCESLPDYDYEQMVAHVEQIKGRELQRNLSICTEQTSGGISTTPGRGQFARVKEPGLSFFGLDATTDSQQRSSLGHTTFSPSGGPIEIFLANQTVVENVSWISYEALVAHELSDAIKIPENVTNNATVNEHETGRLTTDEILARQALANGVSMYVADRYVEQYGGYLNVSALAEDDQNWKHQMVQSVYHSGYRYSEETHRQTIPKTGQPNSTAQILHPDRAMNVTGFPARPNLSIDSLEHVRTDRVGELFLREAFENNGVGSERAASAADGWTNDRMDYLRSNESTVITWRVTFQSADERVEFVETYDAVYDYEGVDVLHSVDCEDSGRYLATSEKTVTVLSCGN